ncbi:MAG TPA: zf-HC2 domain-containing protein [Candidatus Acidoferrum sp.]|jgi:anti-sigma factor RsiW
MTWTCDQIEARLSDYLDGLLQGSERAAFAEHLGECAQCAPLVASVRSMVSGMQAMKPIDVPPRLIYAILDQTLGPRETVTFWNAVGNFLRGLASPKFAYGAASVMATCVIVLTASGFSPKKVKLSDLRPMNIYLAAQRFGHVQYAKVETRISTLRVVNEIQSKLRSGDTDLQTEPEESLPKAAPEKNPGQTNEQRPTGPKQQNRANEIARQMELLAAECPVLYERSYR